MRPGPGMLDWHTDYRAPAATLDKIRSNPLVAFYRLPVAVSEIFPVAQARELCQRVSP
jgi:hypothetical protein